MKLKQFIGKIRKGDGTGTVVVTIPQKTYRHNGMVLGKEYIFEVNHLEDVKESKGG